VFQFLLCDYDQFGLLNKEKPVAIGYYKVNRSLLENDLIEVDLSLINSNFAIANLKSESKTIIAISLMGVLWPPWSIIARI
jgi:hypothetical protein